MATKKRHIRQQRRWAADPSSLYRVMSGLQPYTESERTELLLPAAVCWAAMTSGAGAESDAHTLIVIANVAMVMAESIDQLAVQVAVDAQDAMLRAVERHTRTGRWGMDGPGLQDVPPCLDLYRQLVELSTPAQIQGAMKAVVERMQAKHIAQISPAR